MSIHAAGIIGLVLVFAIGGLRPINLGILALAMMFLVGTIFAGESARDMYAGFPVDLFLLLTGVTYLFGIASSNGTVERIVQGAARLVKNRRGLIPWIVFVVAALPAMAGALGSAGVALLAPLALRLAQRYDLDRRMIGLMVVHGAAAGNFSPLNVLHGVVLQGVARAGLEMSSSALFLGNLAYNTALAVIIYFVFRARRSGQSGTTSVHPEEIATASANDDRASNRLHFDQLCTLLAIVAVAVAALVFDLNIGFVALVAGVTLHLCFPLSSAGADKQIAWSVVLLVCGIVAYVAALQRHGTIDVVGHGMVALSTPLVTALLICTVSAVTSAFASSAGILGVMVPLAVPLMVKGTIGTTGMVVALAISATVVDSTPFSTVGALVVANAADSERAHVYRGLLLWGACMVVTAPFVTWLLFVLPAS